MGNLWAKFNNLGYKETLKVGTVVSQSGNTSTLEDAGGATFTALGTGVAIGLKAFVKGGMVTGEAPNLTESTVYV